MHNDDYQPKHILHMIDSLSPGGAERMLIEIANISVQKGFEVSVAVTRSDLTLAEQIHPGVKLFSAGRERRFDPTPLMELAKFIHLTNPDIIHAHSRSTVSLLSLLRIFRAAPTPILMHDHYGDIGIDTTVPTWFRLWGRHCVDMYVGVYERLTHWAIDAGIPLERVRSINNALDFTLLANAEPLDVSNEFGIPADFVVGAAVGNLRYAKGIDVLISALAQLPKFDNWHILIVGKSQDEVYARSCQELVSQFGLGDHVTFTGFRTDVPSVLKGVDFGVIPSRTESGPLTLIEMMAAGLPFVSTDVGEVARMASDLGLEEFVTACDAQELSDGLARLLSLTANARRLRGKKGVDIAREHFRMETVFEEWMDVYNQTLRLAL